VSADVVCLELGIAPGRSEDRLHRRLDFLDHRLIRARLDQVHAKHPDMVLPQFPKSSSGLTSLLISSPRHVAAKLVFLRELSCSCACARTRRAEADFTQVQRTGRNRQHHRTVVECPWRSPLRSIAVFVDNYLTNKGLLTSNVEITLRRSFVYCYRPCAP
jgi:hypothetical protein